jgi:hypothetical protein
MAYCIRHGAYSHSSRANLETLSSVKYKAAIFIEAACHSKHGIVSTARTENLRIISAEV